MKFSFSALTKFNECGFLWQLHYLEKLRSIEEPSALTFGGAMDKAFTAMLIPGPKTPEEVFGEEWEFNKILNNNPKFSKSDLDEDLLHANQIVGFNTDEKSFFSLQKKGHIMLKALREKVLPNIEEVIAVQEPITLTNQNESGDEFIGFIDFVLKYKGYDKPLIGDLKTSSVLYKPSSVKESPQLGVYTYASQEKFKTDLAAFFVVGKKIRKIRHQTCTKCGHNEVNSRAHTCPATIAGKRCEGKWDVRLEFDADVTVIVDQITAKEEQDVIKLVDDAYNKIKAGEFHQNWNSCINKYHQKCPYYDYCRSGSMNGLVRKV